MDLAEEARFLAETVGLVPVTLPDGPPPAPLPRTCATCPFAVLRTASPWVREVLAAHGTMREATGGVTFRDLTGRDPDVWDARALVALTRSAGEAAEADAALPPPAPAPPQTSAEP